MLKLRQALPIFQNLKMKAKQNVLLLILTPLLLSNVLFAQKGISRFEELKTWKFDYITENTSMNSEELELYKIIFEAYENEYHSKVWTQVHQIRKTLKNSLDTISTSEAACYINKLDDYEIEGMRLKHQRNEKLLKKIHPKVVLKILYQEKRFDRELFNHIRNHSKKKKEK